jgi:hypothetical protein
VAVVALAASCHPSPKVTTRTVTMYVPQACAADGGAFADYFALGDYDPSTPPPATGHPLSQLGIDLPEIDSRARELWVTATESTTWEGIGPVPASGDIDILILPDHASCPLTSGGDAGPPLGPRSGSVLAPIGAGQVLLVGGTGGNVFPLTFMANLTTGAVQPVAVDLGTPRTSASVTAFGQGALVAGGYDTGGTILQSAEIYSTATGGFDQQNPLKLSEVRAHHGAVVLANGQTLLVGGLGGPDGTTVLGSMEIVDPTTPPTVREEGVEQLTFPRSDPVVLRLASGEILVAGGLDANGAPVQTLEWFAADGTADAFKKPQTLAQGLGSAFVALEGGGALAVLTTPSPPPSGFQNVWIIDASDVLEPGIPLATAPTAPVFFGGAGGASALWTGSSWLRWDPYGAAFVAFGELDDSPPAISSTARCSPDPGLGMWLDETQQQLFALRFDTRNAYSTVVNPLLAADTSDTSPDTAPTAGQVSFDPQTGLSLAPQVGVFVTDRTYADVAIDLDAPSGQPAYVEIRDDAGDPPLDVGGADCRGAIVTGQGFSSVHVERHGAQVTWSITAGGSGSGTCACPGGDSARVSVGVRGTSVQSVAQNLSIHRLGDP